MSHRALALLLLAFAAAPAAAATQYASNDGGDSEGCGSKVNPCRSISRAIAHASPGDTVLVGPGRYGNLDGDTELGEDGEEGQVAECSCAVYVDRRISLRSRDGAAATVIEGGLEALAIRVDAAGSEIGRRNAGFTIFAKTGGGISTQTIATDARIAGNIVIAAAPIVLNMMTIDGDGTRVSDNRVVSVEGGIGLLGPQSVAERNAVHGGGSLAHGSTFRSHVGIGQFGLLATGDGVGAVSRSLLAGNFGPGLWTFGTNRLRADRVSLFGNGAGEFPQHAPAFNCGALADEKSALEIERSYWGGPFGPGADPGDAVCERAAGSVAAGPPTRTEIRVKLRPIR
jgi:hypothetical protein